MAKRKPADLATRVRLAEQAVERYVTQRDRSSQFELSGRLSQLRYRGPDRLPSPLAEALVELLGRPLTSSEHDIVLRYSWQAWHHLMRASLVGLGPRAAAAWSAVFQHGLGHERWQVVEASARVVLNIEGYVRDDDVLWARLLRHERWEVRARVAQILSRGRRLGPRAVAALERAREDPAYRVRKYASRVEPHG